MAMVIDAPGPSAAVARRRCEVRDYRGQPTPEARVPRADAQHARRGLR